ncbi:hypothetical protein PR048_013873 [Dryococelus australis]|uniref:Uncharacterized protein n=1 Tax=Dryococelus australis TaxID=614101 RepID=A0ABQ9HTD3_9NEOP|nr:hypothetical protein PR048_013873 [Dryococelus australis]
MLPGLDLFKDIGGLLVVNLRLPGPDTTGESAFPLSPSLCHLASQFATLAGDVAVASCTPLLHAARGVTNGESTDWHACRCARRSRSSCHWVGRPVHCHTVTTRCAVRITVSATTWCIRSTSLHFHCTTACLFLVWPSEWHSLAASVGQIFLAEYGHLTSRIPLSPTMPPGVAARKQCSVSMKRPHFWTVFPVSSSYCEIATPSLTVPCTTDATDNVVPYTITSIVERHDFIQGRGVKVDVVCIQYDGWVMYMKRVVTYQDDGRLTRWWPSKKSGEGEFSTGLLVKEGEASFLCHFVWGEAGIPYRRSPYHEQSWSQIPFVAKFCVVTVTLTFNPTPAAGNNLKRHFKTLATLATVSVARFIEDSSNASAFPSIHVPGVLSTNRRAQCFISRQCEYSFVQFITQTVVTDTNRVAFRRRRLYDESKCANDHEIRRTTNTREAGFETDLFDADQKQSARDYRMLCSPAMFMFLSVVVIPGVSVYTFFMELLNEDVVISRSIVSGELRRESEEKLTFHGYDEEREPLTGAGCSRWTDLPWHYSLESKRPNIMVRKKSTCRNPPASGKGYRVFHTRKSRTTSPGIEPALHWYYVNCDQPRICQPITSAPKPQIRFQSGMDYNLTVRSVVPSSLNFVVFFLPRRNPACKEVPGLGPTTLSQLLQAQNFLATPHQGEPGSIPGRVTGFSQVGIVPDNAVGRRVFSGISHLFRPLIPAPLYTHFNYPHRRSRPRC